MPLINYNRNFTTVGDNESYSQVLYNNYWALSNLTYTPTFVQEIPTYRTIGGTEDYYGQDPLSVFTNLSKPFIRYTFTASTSAITSITKITHKIYKIDYDSFKNFQINQPTSEIEKEVVTRQTEEQPEFKYTQRNREKLGSNSKINYVRGYDEPLTFEGASLLQPLLSEPFAVYTASTQDISTNVYDFYPDQYSKTLGRFKEELFEDKAQYFIETEFEFEINRNRGYDKYYYEENGQLVESDWQDKLTFTASKPSHTISAGDFKGLEVRGAYFSYFKVPEKPNLEYPKVEGELDTFSPEFFWSKSEKADEYLVQITYNTGDTAFSGTVFNYPIGKDEQNKHVAESRIQTPDSNFMSEKTIRSAAIPLKGKSSNFLYRIGNVKYVENIFGVRQFVVSFSETKSATTQYDAIKPYVKVQSDSPHIDTIAEFTTPESLDTESPLAEYMLSGYVSGSIVTGATMQLIFPNSAFITTTTDTSGYFEFLDLESGSYTLNTNYRGYEQNVQNVNLTANTTLNIELQVRWDNIYDKWIVKENDIIKY